MGQNLNCRVRRGIVVRAAVFGRDVVRASNILEVEERVLGEVTTLVGDVEGKGHSVEVGLESRDEVTALASIDVDRNSNVGAYLCRSYSTKERSTAEDSKERHFHCEIGNRDMEKNHRFTREDGPWSLYIP